METTTAGSAVDRISENIPAETLNRNRLMDRKLLKSPRLTKSEASPAAAACMGYTRSEGSARIHT